MNHRLVAALTRAIARTSDSTPTVHFHQDGAVAPCFDSRCDRPRLEV